METLARLETIVHEPYGNRHPYKQQPVERFPRNPLAGEPTALGVAAPMDVEEVWTEWWAVEGREGRAAGTEVEAEDGKRLWRVPLPPFTQGEEVGYRLYGRRGEGVISSERFSFVVAGWRAVTRVVDYRLEEEQLALVLALEETALQATLTLSLQDPGLLKLEWATGGEGQTEDRPAAASSLFTIAEDSPTQIRLTTARLEVVVEREPYRLTICTAEGQPLLEESGSPAWLLGAGEQPLALRQRFASPEDEAFYGFGERFNALNQRGQQLDVRVYEQYKEQGTRTYIPVPFFLSSRGYGLYLDSNRYVAYDLASTGEEWSFQAEVGEGPAAALSCYLIVREQPWQIVSSFSDLTGKPALPPAWAFGPWMSSNDWNSQAMVTEEVRQTQAHEIPVTVLVIEAWSDEVTFYIWNDAHYEPRPGAQAFGYEDFTFSADGLWPDPKGMVDALHDQGIRLLLWQIPVLKALDEPHPQQDNDEAHMLTEDYHVREGGGEPYRIRPFWFHEGLVWDVTNPAGVEWWLQKRAYLLEMGVDGFKTDGGEHIWGRDLRFTDGRRGDELWNLYPNLYVGAYYRFANEKRDGNAITFSRAGFSGAQAYPCHWAGDENSTWEAFRASILAGLNAGISGIPFWGWDIAGFSGEIPTAELYLRSTAMATFCPVMQYHSEYNARRTPSRDRTPWNIQTRTGDEDVIPIFRYFANLRMNLLPYIISEAWHASQTGVPLMRALPLVFPGDAQAREYPYQYLLGSALLLAPVVEPAQEVWPVYLPEGVWYDFWTGTRYEGAQAVEIPVPKDRIPVFVRAGAVLPLNLGQSLSLGSAVGNQVDRYQHLCFRLYPEGGLNYHWYDHLDGRSYAIQSGRMADGRLTVTLPPIPYPVILIVCGLSIDHVTLDKERPQQCENSADWQQAAPESWYRNGARDEVWVRLTPSTEGRTLHLTGSSPLR